MFDLSIVIAVLNEEENIFPVCQELAKILPELPNTEVIFVDDGSTDQTLSKLIEAKETIFPSLTILSHEKCCGKSQALLTAIEEAQGKWIATMDGDGQDDPRDIIAMWNTAQNYQGRPPLVVGVRLKRNDNLSRRLATRLANKIRESFLKDGCTDTGAPMKLFLKEDFLKFPHFEGMHRFFPALFKHYGVPQCHYPVHHRPRLHGLSKYTNFNRAMVGIADLLGMMWLLNRIKLPNKINKF